MLRWHKLGRVFVASGQSEWLNSHGVVPIPRPLGGRIWRIYFTPRDRRNRANVSWVDVDLARPTEVLRVSERPVLAPGQLGCFDDSGAMGAWIVECGEEERLYYQGWSLPRLVPFHVAIGLAVRRKGDPDAPFERVSAGPIMDRCAEEPFFVGNPAILPGEAGGWRMWYLSGDPWGEAPEGPLARYRIRHAVSTDGLRWTPDTLPALGHIHPGEAAIARFCPLREPDGGWTAFYSYRGDDWPYRIGMARSADGLHWTRDDSASGMRLDDDGWERVSVSYPTVFDAEGARWMLYNAGRYGDAGFGIAVLDQD